MGLRNNRIIALLLALCLVVSLTVAVYAYLSTTGGSVTNTFTPDVEKDPSINEEFNANQKTDVKVNVGELDYAVYVRAVVVVTWKDDAGKVHAQKPIAGTDYSIILNVGDGKPWFQQGDFYYYRWKVDSKEPNEAVFTDVLINSCKPLTAAPTGYSLHVEIIAQTIQAVGTTDKDENGDEVEVGIPAVTDAWGIEVDSGTKELKETTP